jgi:hypothetical protein
MAIRGKGANGLVSELAVIWLDSVSASNKKYIPCESSRKTKLLSKDRLQI